MAGKFKGKLQDVMEQVHQVARKIMMLNSRKHWDTLLTWCYNEKIKESEKCDKKMDQIKRVENALKCRKKNFLY